MFNLEIFCSIVSAIVFVTVFAPNRVRKVQGYVSGPVGINGDHGIAIPSNRQATDRSIQTEYNQLNNQPITVQQTNGTALNAIPTSLTNGERKTSIKSMRKELRVVRRISHGSR